MLHCESSVHYCVYSSIHSKGGESRKNGSNRKIQRKKTILVESECFNAQLPFEFSVHNNNRLMYCCRWENEMGIKC